MVYRTSLVVDSNIGDSLLQYVFYYRGIVRLLFESKVNERGFIFIPFDTNGNRTIPRDLSWENTYYKRESPHSYES